MQYLFGSVKIPDSKKNIALSWLALKSTPPDFSLCHASDFLSRVEIEQMFFEMAPEIVL